MQQRMTEKINYRVRSSGDNANIIDLIISDVTKIKNAFAGLCFAGVKKMFRGVFGKVPLSVRVSLHQNIHTS